MSSVRKTCLAALFLTAFLESRGICWAEEYVDAGIIREMLDCDGTFTNGQKLTRG